MSDAIVIGQQAPDFTLKNEEGESVSLKDLKGKPVVLVFYALDWSPVCHGEMCNYRDDYSEVQSKGATVLGISRDSIFSHKAWKESLGLGYSLLADMKGDVAKQYGAWNNDLGLSERLTVVIDRDGTVRYVDRSPDLKTARDHKKVLEALKSTQ